MHLFRSISEECADIIAKLSTSNNRVVAEHHSFSIEHRTVRDKLHASYKITSRLVARGKRAGPGWGVFQDGTLIRDTVTFGIAQSMADTRIGDTTNAIGLRGVLLSHRSTTGFAHRFNIYAEIIAGRKAIINPKERADLLTSGCLLEHFHAISFQLYNLARSKVANNLIIQIRERRSLGCGSICTFLLTDNDRCTAQIIARCDNAVFGQHQHRARALDILVDKVNTLYKVLTHINEQGHKLSLVDIICRQLAEMHFFSQQFIGNFTNIVDFCYRNNRITAEMRVYDNRLRIGVANDTQARATDKRVEFVFKL